MLMMGKMCSSPCRRVLLLLLSNPSLPQQTTLIQRAANSYSNGMLRFYSQLAPQRRPGPLSLYRSLVEEGKLQYDFYQERVASELEDLLGRLEQYEMDMEEYHVNLANWEKNRENERRRLLMEEAEAKQQQGGVRKSINKHRNGFFEKWILRRKNVDVEPGVGKMVSYLNREKKMDAIVGTRPVAPPAPKGLYLYGNVGSGKTMLMDMFYSATEGIVRHRRRFHFHEAMLEIHEHMHKIWKNQVVEKSSQSVFSSWIGSLPFDTKVKEWMAAEEQYKQEVQMKHILPDVADRFLVNRQTDQVGASILCFDEIQTVDVFAIVALSGIVSRLLSTGTVLVATSNRAPEDLNQDGMQREIFQKLVSHLGEHCQNILVGSEIDYRRLIAKRTVEQVHYFWPLDDQAFKEFEKMWCKIINESGGRIVSNTIRVMFGRILEVPESCNGVARFTFDYLCGRPVGAADYIAVAKNYHTVFISDIPVMSMRIRGAAFQEKKKKAKKKNKERMSSAAVPCPNRQFKLAKESELRIEVGMETSLRLRLLSGTAEIFGTELPPDIWVSFPPSLKIAIFTWNGATIEVNGMSEVEYVADETPMVSYVNVHAILDGRRACAKGSATNAGSSQGPRVIIVGPTDSGKSSLSKMLLSWASKQSWKPTFVDLDIGQGSITIPGCIAATPIEMPIDPVEGIPLEMPLVYVFGHTTPSANPDLYKVLVKELAQSLERQFAGSVEARAAGMVINTMGWVEGLGYELLLHAIDAFNVNVVLVLGQEKLCSMLKDVLKTETNVDIVRLHKSGGVVPRNSKFRQRTRSYRIREYFYGLANDLSPHSNVANFNDIFVYRIGGGPQAPRSALPIGAEPAADPTRLVPVNINRDLLHLVLAVSYAKETEEIISSNVAGFIYVTDIDIQRKKITYLAPCPGELPSRYLIAGTLTWLET